MYCALIKGLQVASSKGIRHILVLGDAELVINQMTAFYDVTHIDERLAGLNRFAKKTASYFKLIDFKWIPERKNVEADSLAELGVRRQGSHEQLTLIT
jgi:ribonuclease HI